MNVPPPRIYAMVAARAPVAVVFRPATSSGHLEVRDAGRPDLPVVIDHDLSKVEPAPSPAPAWATRW